MVDEVGAMTKLQSALARMKVESFGDETAERPFSEWKMDVVSCFGRVGLAEAFVARTLPEEHCDTIMWFIMSALKGTARKRFKQSGPGLYASWRGLLDLYESERAASRGALIRDLVAPKTPAVAEMQKFLTGQSELRGRVSALEQAISEDDLLIHGVLTALPDELSGIKDIALGMEDLTWARLENLVSDKLAALEGEGRAPNLAAFSAETGAKTAATCMWCGKTGHYATNCFARKAAGGGGKGKPKGAHTGGSEHYGGKGGRKCYRCGKTGHEKKDCPNKKVFAAHAAVAEATSS